MKVQGGNDRNLRSHFVSKRLQQRSFSIRVSFCHHSAMESQQNTIHTLLLLNRFQKRVPGALKYFPRYNSSWLRIKCHHRDQPTILYRTKIVKNSP